MRASASDFAPQPDATAANRAPVAAAACVAACGGFLLAIALRMPRELRSASTPAMAGSAAGGTAPGAANVIAYNLNTGVTVVPDASSFPGTVVIGSGQSDAISGNSIHSNSGLGIDLGLPTGVLTVLGSAVASQNARMVHYLLAGEVAHYAPGSEHAAGGDVFWRVHHAFNTRFERFRARYRDALAWALDHRRLVLVVFGAFFAVSLAVAVFTGQDFFPQVDAGQFRLHVRAPAGTSLSGTYWSRSSTYTMLLNGTIVINNPFWWSADDKFFNYALASKLGVAVPNTVVLPHKTHPAGTTVQSMRNLAFPLNWDEVFDYIGFPAFLKPFSGGGWKHVYKIHSREEFFNAYDQTGSLCMTLQSAVEFDDYYRCYVVGQEKVRIMKYDPKQPHHLRYVRDGAPRSQTLQDRLVKELRLEGVSSIKAGNKFLG